MKKMINFLTTITLVSSTTLSVISCGNTKPTTSFYEIDYNTAFNTVFYNENNINNKNFSMLPKLNKVEKSSEIPAPKTKSQFKLNGTDIKLNCNDFNCYENNSFSGIGLTTTKYNTILDSFEERMKAQYALDDLASWFSIQPNSNEDYLYDFSSLSFYVDYSRNTYFFNKYEIEENLILWSKENYIEIKDSDRNINSEFIFYDKKFELNSNRVKELLNADDVEITKVTSKGQEDKETYNKLDIEFTLAEDSKIDEIENQVKNLFSKYQSNLEFKENKDEIEKQESEKLPSIELEENKIIIWDSTNLNNFTMKNEIIKQISIKFTIKSETEGETNEKNTLHII